MSGVADATFGPKVHYENSGNDLVVESGGVLTLLAGATLVNAGSSTLASLTATAADGSGSGVIGSGHTFTTGAGGGGNAAGGPFTINLGAGTGTSPIGQFSIVVPTGIGTNAGTVSIGGTNIMTLPASPVTVIHTYVQATFKGVDNTLSNSARAFDVESHWADSVNGVGTLSGPYANVFHDGAGTTITDHIGLVGRTYVTSTGTSINMDGVYGSVGFSGAGAVTHAASLHAKDPPVQTAACVITNLYGVRIDAGAVATILVTNYYGAMVLNMPSGASGNNIGFCVGPAPAGTNTAGVWIGASGLTIASGGITNLLNGIMTKGSASTPPADTTSTNATIAIASGSNTGANDRLTALYYYKSNVVASYVGYDSDTSTVVAGHTKLVTDYVIAPTNNRYLLFDTNGYLWVRGQVNAGVGLAVTQTISTSAQPTANLIITGGAHTTLVNSEVIDVNWALARTVQFTGTATLATNRSIVITAPTFTSDTATKAITTAATMAFSGPPLAGANVTLTAPNTTILWLGSGVATVAGGALASAIAIGVTGGVPTMGLYWGSGAPTIAAPKGSLYIRTDGTTTNDRAYINTNASTTWTALTTVA